MATNADRSRIAQIVALALDQGQSNQQILARLYDFGVAPGSAEQDEAFRLGRMAFNWGAQMSLGNVAGAEAVRRQLEAAGFTQLVVFARTEYVPAGTPEGAEVAEEDRQYRTFKSAVPIGSSSADIAALVGEWASGLTESMQSPPPPGDYRGVTFQYGAPR